MALRIWGVTLVIGFGYWLGALARSGIAFEALADLPLTVLIPWKGACTAGLALSVYLSGQDGTRRLLALALAISAVADMILATRAMVPAGVLFSISHLIALAVFWRNRAQPVAGARLACAIAIPVTSFGLSLLAIHGSNVPLFFALYPLLSGVMAAAAVLSRFPLWLCGLGAAVFICSDVLVLAWLGVLQRDPSFGYLTWLTYFGGYAMVARGAALGPRKSH
jgi:hypothetical protein